MLLASPGFWLDATPMDIIPDPVHVALLSLPFFVTVLGLYLILWQPLLDWLEQREQVSTTAYLQARELEQSADDQLKRIEARLTEAHQDAGTIRQEARDRAAAREAEIVSAARTKADGEIQEAVKTIRQEQEAARDALRSTAQELSTTIAARVLGRDLS